MRAVLDANVIRTGLATRFEPHELQRLRWGRQELVSVVLRRTHAPRIKSVREAGQIPYVPALLEAHRLGTVQLYSTTFIEHEKHTQKSLRTDRSVDVFNLPTLIVLEDPSFSRVLGQDLKIRPLIRPPEHLKELYDSILNHIGTNKQSDAAHILTAHDNQIEYLITLDTRLTNAATKLEKIGVNVKVIGPKEAACVANLAPWTDSRIQQAVSGSDVFVSQRVIELAQRKRWGPLGVFSASYVGRGRYAALTAGQVRQAIKTLRRQIYWRSFLRVLGPQLIWTFGNQGDVRQLDKTLAEPIQIAEFPFCS